ncbi:MAG: bifunctional PIG-L family deacetylase/class I SAM-dependent methyltransferase, partial [Saprospiraceae bacterium]
ESLGCGGLMALLARRGQEVHVLFTSDGAMSHPGSRKYSPAARRDIREGEALRACAALDVPPTRVTFLRLPDTAVPHEGENAFAPALNRIKDYLGDLSPDVVLVPWRRDPHTDHRATWFLLREATRQLGYSGKWIEYPIWMWDTDRADDLPQEDEMIGWQLDVAAVLEQKETAIRAHASQLTDLIDDDPTGFRLDEGFLQNFLRPTEVYFEDAEKREHSLPTDYFDRVYAAGDDPWNFETSDYEREKYATTLAAIAGKTFPRALEIGCSIGVLTEQLAPQCGYLLGVDASELPLEKAARRLRHLPQVELRQMSLPAEFPEEKFDLILLSEVGYYWSRDDLRSGIEKITDALHPGGCLLLVHYTPYIPDYPLTGDEVHDTFARLLPENEFIGLKSLRRERYRLDCWERHAG